MIKPRPSAAKYVSQPHRPSDRRLPRSMTASGMSMHTPATTADWSRSISSVTSAMGRSSRASRAPNGCFCENKSTIVFHRIRQPCVLHGQPGDRWPPQRPSESTWDKHPKSSQAIEKVSFTEGKWKLGHGKCRGSRENRLWASWLIQFLRSSRELTTFKSVSESGWTAYVHLAHSRIPIQH